MKTKDNSYPNISSIGIDLSCTKLKNRLGDSTGVFSAAWIGQN